MKPKMLSNKTGKMVNIDVLARLAMKYVELYPARSTVTEFYNKVESGAVDLSQFSRPISKAMCRARLKRLAEVGLIAETKETFLLAEGESRSRNIYHMPGVKPDIESEDQLDDGRWPYRVLKRNLEKFIRSLPPDGGVEEMFDDLLLEINKDRLQFPCSLAEFKQAVVDELKDAIGDPDWADTALYHLPVAERTKGNVIEICKHRFILLEDIISEVEEQ